MSWWVYLKNKDEVCEIMPRHCDGGTFVLGGTNQAELNITYNYSPFYYKYFDKKEGLKFLDSKKAKDCIKKLEEAISKLGIKRDDNYWKATEGNAGYALSILLSWAKQHPDAIFEVR